MWWIALAVLGIAAIDAGVWSVRYRTTTERGNWRVMDANFAVIFTNLALTTAVLIGFLAFVLTR